MTKPSIMPDPAALIPSLRAVRDDMRTAGCGTNDDIDVRLQVYPDGTWCIRWGDASFDLDHTGFWGAVVMYIDSLDFKDLAEMLVSDAAEMESQMSEEL